MDFPSRPSRPMNVPATPQLSWDSIAKASPQPPSLELAGDVARALGSCKSSRGVAVAVVDASAVIQGGERLSKSADRFVSVPEVMAEIRDPVSRHRLAFLPFTVDPVEPSPESLKKVVSFARATGDLQTLSDVDLKLISLTYTLEAQINGTEHLRDTPPPIHVINVKRLPEKEMPGWGSNVPNLKEWEALEHQFEDTVNSSSKILPLKDLNIVPTEEHPGPGDELAGVGSKGKSEDQEGVGIKPNRYSPKKKGINIEGKKMVASGVDASHGEHDDDSSEWLPAVSRSTHRRFLRRKARREALSEKDVKQDGGMEKNILKDSGCEEQQVQASSEKFVVVSGNSETRDIQDGPNSVGELLSIIKDIRLEENSLSSAQEDQNITCGGKVDNNSEAIDDIPDGSEYLAGGRNEAEIVTEDLDQVDIVSHNSESVDASYVDDNSSEHSWKLRSLSDSSVACVTSDFAMQNVILQIGLRLLAPEGKQIRQLHRWILKCHACYTVTAEIGRIFCPKCGNGGTLRKLSVTVGENGIVQSARRPRIILRGTKFSLPLPKGGRDAITKNPVLREDQLPHKVLYPRRKKKVNKQGEDIFTSDDIFFNHATDKKASLKPPVGKAVSLFYGRRNPNDNHYSRASVRH